MKKIHHKNGLPRINDSESVPNINANGCPRNSSTIRVYKVDFTTAECTAAIKADSCPCVKRSQTDIETWSPIMPCAHAQ